MILSCKTASGGTCLSFNKSNVISIIGFSVYKTLRIWNLVGYARTIYSESENQHIEKLSVSKGIV